ncbi:MAG TPA: hypothetical protein VF459_06900 [Caulobacteraceae bacterium]
MTEAFDTPIEDCGDEFAGPWRSPKQMLAAQEYDAHASIHDDATAQSLGFKGGTIEGPTHFSQFEPLGAKLWGRAWFENGCISAHYRSPVFEGETVRAFVTKPDAGAKHTTIFMRKADGTEVLAGSLSVGQDAARAPTALEARLKDLPALAEPVILRDISVGMASPRLKVIMGPDQHMGAYYPFSLADKLKVITEPSPWHRDGEGGSASPWGRPIIPLEMLSVLFQHKEDELRFPVRGPVVGLFADQEIRLLEGPLFVGEVYEIERQVVALSGSRRTESLWVKTTAYRVGSSRPVATMLLNAASIKASYTPYDREHDDRYGPVKSPF